MFPRDYFAQRYFTSRYLTGHTICGFFPHRYFALRYFAGRYFSPIQPAGGYFAHRYFASVHFAPRYFCPHVSPVNDGPLWAVVDGEWARWTPQAAPDGWRVIDTEIITWPDTGNVWHARDREFIVWEPVITGDVAEGQWVVEDQERIRWITKVGASPECVTGDGVPGFFESVGNYVF